MSTLGFEDILVSDLERVHLTLLKAQQQPNRAIQEGPYQQEEGLHQEESIGRQDDASNMKRNRH